MTETPAKASESMKTASRDDSEHGPLPKKHVVIPFDLHFTESEMTRIKRGLVPEQMEDKWFIFYEDDVAYFHRSWTGYCVYQAFFRSNGGGATLSHAKVNRDDSQYKVTEDDYDRKMLPFLIDLLLLHKPAVFPKVDDDPEINVVKAWSLIGNASAFVHPSSWPEPLPLQVDVPPRYIRIVPANRFCGLPAPAYRPYAFYADARAVEGKTVAQAYRFLKGLDLPLLDGGYQRENYTPFLSQSFLSDPDALLPKISISKNKFDGFGNAAPEDYENQEYVVFQVPNVIAGEHFDIFPATWRALSYIVSDPQRMGVKPLDWNLTPDEFARIGAHMLFREAQSLAGGSLLALRQSKEALGLNDLSRLPEPEEEETYYHYLSTDSALTNRLVELFGISHRCWHGCGYLGYPDNPLCRFFLLLNRLTPHIKVSLSPGSRKLRKMSCKTHGG